MAAATPRIIVVGGGLAGLSAVIKIAEAGGKVDLFSIVPVKRSHSVCAQGGINSAKNLKGEGDTPFKHFDDTIYGSITAPPSQAPLPGNSFFMLWMSRSAASSLRARSRSTRAGSFCQPSSTPREPAAASWP
jgi:hypothetical protein